MFNLIYLGQEIVYFAVQFHNIEDFDLVVHKH